MPDWLAFWDSIAKKERKNRMCSTPFFLFIFHLAHGTYERGATINKHILTTLDAFCRTRWHLRVIYGALVWRRSLHDFVNAIFFSLVLRTNSRRWKCVGENEWKTTSCGSWKCGDQNSFLISLSERSRLLCVDCGSENTVLRANVNLRYNFRECKCL